MAKRPNVTRLSSGFRSSNKLNDNIDQINEAFDNTLSRDGSGPNEMLASLDMNNNRIINLPEPVDPQDPARLQDLVNVSIDLINPEIIEDAVTAGSIAGALAGAEAAEDKLPKIQYPNILEIDPSANDGSTNATSALTDITYGFIVLPAGSYRIGTNVTISRPLHFAPGATMTIDSGVTVTFSGSGRITSDSRRQIFYGAGNVEGLPAVDTTWFVGDKIFDVPNGTMLTEGPISLSVITKAEADTELQKAFNSYRANAQVFLHEGGLALAGTNYMSIPKRASIQGNKETSFFIFTGDNPKGFKLEGACQQSTMSGFWMRRRSYDEPATSGDAIQCIASQCLFEKYQVIGFFNGYVSYNCAGGTHRDFEYRHCMNTAISWTNTNDPILSAGIIFAVDEFLTFSGPTSDWNPQPDDVLTGANGVRFRVIRIGTSGKVIATKYYADLNKPQLATSFTCSSGGAAVLTGYAPCHNTAGILINQTGDAYSNLMEAVMIDGVDVIGGLVGLRVSGFDNSSRKSPTANKIVNSFFDSSLDAALRIEYCEDLSFANCNFSSKFVGAYTGFAKNTRFVNCSFRWCASTGLVIEADTGNIGFTNCIFVDNRTGNQGTVSGTAGAFGGTVQIDANFAGHATFVNSRFGISANNGIRPEFGITTGTSITGMLTLIGNSFQGVITRPIDTPANIASWYIIGNRGLKSKAKGYETIASGQSATSTIAHGLHLSPTFYDLDVRNVGPNGFGGGAYLGWGPLEVTSTSFAVRLYNSAGSAVNASTAVGFTWEIDMSEKGV